jgi:hypothetical protein
MSPLMKVFISHSGSSLDMLVSLKMGKLIDCFCIMEQLVLISLELFLVFIIVVDTCFVWMEISHIIALHDEFL